MWLAEPVFTHGQLNVAVSRVGSRDKIRFAIKPVEEGWNNFTSNVVFKEVLLDSPQPSNSTQPGSLEDFCDSVAADLDTYSPSDLEYEGPNDEMLPETDVEDDNDFKKPLPVKRHRGHKVKRSASQPKDLAPPDKAVPRKRPLTSAAHEAWIAGLPDPTTDELTEEEKEREAMVERRSQYFKRMFGNL